MTEHRNNNRRSESNNYQPRKRGETQAVVVSDTFGDPRAAHIIPIQAVPLEVKVYGGGFDKAMRAFRALVQKERILSTYKERQGYEKPSDKKRRKRSESMRKEHELKNFTPRERRPSRDRSE